MNVCVWCVAAICLHSNNLKDFVFIWQQIVACLKHLNDRNEAAQNCKTSEIIVAFVE